MDFRYPLSACLFLSAFCSASAVRAASPWIDTHAPSSATITVLGKSARGTLLAGTSYGYLFRSTDNGETWARTHDDRSSVPPRVFLAGGDSLILAAYGSLPNPLLDCFDGCGTHGTVLASMDDGKSWTATGSEEFLALGRGPQGVPIIAGKGMHIFSRENVGWTRLAFGFSAAPRPTLYPFWTAIASSGSRLVGIYDSILYSAEYRPGRDSVTFSKVMDTPVASLFQSGSSTLVSTGQGLYRFEGFRDNGATVKILIDTSKVSGIMEADSGYLIGKSGNRLRRGNAQGGAWQPWGPELPDSIQAMVWLGKAVIAGGSGIPQPLRSVSGGPWAGFGTGVSEFPTDPLLVTREAIFGSINRGVMFTRTKGAPWSQVDSLGPEKNVTFMAQGNRTFWAGGKSLWRATGDPAHAHWTLPRGIDPGMVPLRFGATGKHILASYYANVGGEVYNFLAVCPVDGDSCRVTPPGALGKPRSYSHGIGNLVYGFAGLGDTIVAADSLLHRSVDGGRTWDTLPPGLIAYAKYAFLGKRLLSFGEGSRNNCGLGYCWQYSDDVGETWKQISLGGAENAPVFDFQVSGGVFFSANDSGVFESTDGLEWKEYARPGGRLRSLAAGDGIVAVGTEGCRLRIMEPETVGLKQSRRPAIPIGAGNGILRNGILVKDARGTLRRMDGKAAANPPARK